MMDELGLEDIDMDESDVTSHIASLGHSPERNNIPASARSGVSDWDTSVGDETPRDSKAIAGDTSKKANLANESKTKPANKATHDSDSQWDSDDDDDDNKIPVLPSKAGKNNLDPPGALENDACGSTRKIEAVKSMSGSVSTEYDMEEKAEAKSSVGSLFDSGSSLNCDLKEKQFHDENFVNSDQIVKLFDAQKSRNCGQKEKQLDAQSSMNCDQIVMLLDAQNSMNFDHVEKLFDGEDSVGCDQIVKLFNGKDSMNCDQNVRLFDGEDSMNCDPEQKLHDAQSSMNCDQREKQLEAQNTVNCDQKEKLLDAQNSVNCDQKQKMLDAQNSVNCDQKQKELDTQNSVNCDQKEKGLDTQNSVNCDGTGELPDAQRSVNCNQNEEGKGFFRVEEFCANSMSFTADIQDVDNYDKVDDDWDDDDGDSEKKDAEEEEIIEEDIKEEACTEEELEDEEDRRAVEGMEKIKQQEMLEQMCDEQEKMKEKEKVKAREHDKEAVKNEEAEKKTKTDEEIKQNDEEKEEFHTSMEKVKATGEREESGQMESQFPAIPFSGSMVVEKKSDQKDSCLPVAGSSTAADEIKRKFNCDLASSETALSEVSSCRSSLTGDTYVIESEFGVGSKEAAPECNRELSIKKRPYDKTFDVSSRSYEKADAQNNGKEVRIENVAEMSDEFEENDCSERLSSPRIDLEGSSSIRGHDQNQNLSAVVSESCECKSTAMEMAESEFVAALEATPHMTVQEAVGKKVSSKVENVKRMIKKMSQSDAVHQKTTVQEEENIHLHVNVETQLLQMDGSCCLSLLEEVCEQSNDESSFDELLKNCPQECFDAEKNNVSLDDLITCEELHARKSNVTKEFLIGYEGKFGNLAKEANATEDEEESTWEKERKLAKKSAEVQKAEVKYDVTTEKAQSNHEIAPDNTTSLPKVKAEERKKEVVFGSPPLEANRNRDLNLSSASASSFQQKQAPATSSGRIPLASAVIPLRIKMSQEESTSDTDEPLSPIGSARSTARSVSLNTDMNNVIRLQEMIRDGQRKLESERSAKTLLETKRKALENERTNLVEQLHVITREKFNLDQLKIDLESKVRHLEYQLSEEIEKRKNTDVLYEKTKEQLTRKDEQFLQLTEAKQKTETSLKNEQKEKASAMAVLKQLEDENESLKRQLNEKNIFVVQDEGPAEHHRKSLIKSGTVVGSEGYPHHMPTVGASAELYAAQLEMNRERERTKDRVEELMHENDELRKLNKEMNEKWSRGEEALTHASLHYNLDVVQLKADNDRLSSQLEKDSAGKEELEREVNSLKLQLSSLTSDLQAARDAKAEFERQRRHHADDFSRMSEHHHQELLTTKSLCQSQSQQISEVLPKLQKLESELVVANTLLSERTTQLATLQKDLEKRSSTQDTSDENYRKQKEENIRLEAKVESLQQRLSEAQEDVRLAKHSSELRRPNGEQPDDLATLLNSLKVEHDRAKSSLEDRNTSLMESLSKIKEELKSAERGRLNTEDEKRRLQAALNETQKSQLASEASLQVANQARQQLEVDRSQLKIEIDQLKDKLEEGRQRILRLDQKILELSQQLKTAESSATNSYEQLNKESNSLQGLLKVKRELEESLHRMEVENAKLEAALTHERQKVSMLQKDYNESKQNQNRLEDEFEKLKSSNKELQYMMNEAAGLKTQATQEADDNRTLWESEIKSRSKLGLRLAQLEREKRELDSKVQEEKRRVRRALELKKSTEEKLDEEQGRSSQLLKEVSVLKVHLKAAKKRIKELQVQGQTVVHCRRCRRNGVDSDILDNGSEAENIYQNGHSSAQLDFAKHQLHYEPAMKDHRHRGSGISDFDKLRNMENLRVNGSAYHLDQMPHQVIGSNCVATSEIDRIREKLKSEAQMELNLKLQEVNRYLDDQAVARERLDRIRDVNEAEMRNEFEKVRKEMLEEISKVKHNFEGIHSAQKGPRSNETQQQMKELHEREAKLKERLLDRLDNAYSKVTNSDIDRLYPNITNVDDVAFFDGELAKSSVQHGINDTVMNNLRQQLDKSIARHMAATADDHNEVTTKPLLLDPVGSGRNSSYGDPTSVLHRNFLL